MTELREFHIRAYESRDLADVNRICLRTGDNGRDASSHYADPELLGLYYTSPYVVFEPELCSILTHQSEPCGYVMGTKDSIAFFQRLEREWLPTLRIRYPLPRETDASPDAKMIRKFHSVPSDSNFHKQFPAHLHLDLLPIAQGQGWGQKMMELFLGRIQSLGVAGVHLGVGSQNHRAIQFYRRMGFEQIADEGESLIMGQLLTPSRC